MVAGDGAALGLDQRRRREAVVPVRPEVVDPLVRDLLLHPVQGGVVTGAVLLLLSNKIQMNIKLQGSAKRRGLGCINSLSGSAWL